MAIQPLFVVIAKIPVFRNVLLLQSGNAGNKNLQQAKAAPVRNRLPGGRLLCKPVILIGLFLCVQPGLWSSLLNGYQGDDFFTLTMRQRIGLLALSSILIALIFMAARQSTIWLNGLLHRYPPRLICLFDCTIRALGFVACHTFSPQIYYSYYRTIIAGLPLQWVVKLPTFDQAITLVSLSGDGRLAEHLAGIVFWSLLLTAGRHYAASVRWLLIWWATISAAPAFANWLVN